jgi:hypothetical protein
MSKEAIGRRENFAHNKAIVDGLYKIDHKGERVGQLFCHFDADRKQ